MGYRIEEMPKNWVGVGERIAAHEENVSLFPAAQTVEQMHAAWSEVPEEHRARACVIAIFGDATNYLQIGYFV